MIKPYVFLGKPLNFKNICKVYPPTVNDVIDNDFEVFYSMLTITQEDLDDELCGKTDQEGNPLYIPTPFEYLLGNAYANNDFLLKANNAIKFFIHEDCCILPETSSILIGNLEESLIIAKNLDDLIFIKAEDYTDFQELIRKSCGRSYEAPEDLSQLHPKIREMKMKARERDKIKAKQDAKKAPSLENTLAAICCMECGLNPLNIGEISYAAINKLIETNQRHEKYDLDCRSLMMGADPKKVKLEYWIRQDDKD